MSKTKKLKRAIKRAQKMHAKYKSQRHRIGSIMKPAHSVWLRNKSIAGLSSMHNDPHVSAANSLLTLRKTPMAEAQSLLSLKNSPNYGSLSSSSESSSSDDDFIEYYKSKYNPRAINKSFRK